MGKQRDADERRIDAFVAELKAYGKRMGKEVNISKSFRKQIIHVARKQGRTVEAFLVDLTANMKSTMDTVAAHNVPCSFASFVEKKPTLH